MKKEFALGALFGVIFSLVIACTPAMATATTAINAVYSSAKIMLNDQEVQAYDVHGKSIKPINVDGTTYLPLRYTASALGFSVSWNETSNVITLIPTSDQYYGYNTSDVAGFAQQIKDYITHDDKSDLSTIISYPVSVNINGVKTQIDSADEFMQNYSAIIIDTNFKNAIMTAPISALLEHEGSIMLGSNEKNIWFSGIVDKASNETGKYTMKILAINN